MPPPGYLAGVRALADQHGIMLILDEVMAGFGRTGDWFAFDAYDVVPDLITFAKGVNSGYVPVGGVIISDADRRALRRHACSRAGSPTAGIRWRWPRSSRRSTRWTSEGIVDNAAAIGADVIGPGLAELADKHAGDRRGPRRRASSGRSSWSPTATTREPLSRPP